MNLTNQVGIFYKRNGKWVGPWNRETFKSIDPADLVEAKSRLKSKVAVFRMCWKKA